MSRSALGSNGEGPTLRSGRFRRWRRLRRYSGMYFQARRCYYLLRYRRLSLERGVRIGGRLRLQGTVRAHIGAGSRVTRLVHITGRGTVTVGRNTLLNGPWIGCWTDVTIGDRCLIGEADIVDTDYHNLQPELRHQMAEGNVSAPIVIEDNVWVGSRAAILKGVTVGTGSVLGWGTVVRRSVPARVVVIGDPQQIVKRFDEQADAASSVSNAEIAEPGSARERG